MSTTAHIAHACTTTLSGVPMITSMLYSAGFMLIGTSLGWYLKGRGMAGVQIDLANIKTDVENLKAKVMNDVSAAT